MSERLDEIVDDPWQDDDLEPAGRTGAWDDRDEPTLRTDVGSEHAAARSETWPARVVGRTFRRPARFSDDRRAG